MLLVAALGAMVIAGTGFARRHLKTLHKKVSEQEGKVSGFLQETFEKLLLVQAMDAASEIERRSGVLLDVCTSALDAETEQKVLQRLRALPKRTCIAVTHRPAAMALCDWRLEFGEGKIRCVQNFTE